MNLLQIFEPGYYELPYLTIVIFGFIFVFMPIGLMVKSKTLKSTSLILLLSTAFTNHIESKKVFYHKDPDYEEIRKIQEFHLNAHSQAFNEYMKYASIENKALTDSLESILHERSCQYDDMKRIRDKWIADFEARKRRMTIFNVLTIE